MIEAFWDSSALVPLCIDFQANSEVDKLFQQFAMVVWWAAAVEVRSGLARLQRMQQLSAAGVADGLIRLIELKHKWQEIEPSTSLRDLAEELPVRYGLRAADALQLAAACTWVMWRPANRRFISGDQKLLDAARHMGFHVITI